MTTTHSDPQSFWGVRSRYYDRLYWARDGEYLADIVKWANLKPSHLVLDVGTGTGAVAKAIKDRVRHVLAVDLSGDMLKKGSWEGISVLQWDVSDALFRSYIFDRVIARMVLHHAVDNLRLVLANCYAVLKEGGKFVVAEATPPSDAQEVVDWFDRMFRMKEYRVTFTSKILKDWLELVGFRKIATHVHWVEGFSVRNWLTNSGLPKERQDQIMEFHRQAPAVVKRAHQMKLTKTDCLLRSRNVIMVGVK